MSGLAPRLDAKARQRGATGRVGSTGCGSTDHVGGAETPDRDRRADGPAMPSRGEGFGTAPRKASGVPVAASAAGGSCEAVGDDRLASVADPGDQPAMASAVVDAPGPPKAVPAGLERSWQARSVERWHTVADQVFVRDPVGRAVGSLAAGRA